MRCGCNSNKKQILTMMSYTYFRILINFCLLLHLLGVCEMVFTTDHFYVLLDFVNANSINFGAKLIH